MGADPRHATESGPTDEGRPVATPRHAADPDATSDAERPEALDVTGDGGRRRLTFAQHVVAFLRELSIVVIGALLVSTLLRAFVGQMFDIPSSSMVPTLQVGDRVLVEKFSPVNRGDVVVFRDPGGWLGGAPPEPTPAAGALEFIGVLPASGSDHLIKRVVGVPGDTVICCDEQGRLSVNGAPVDEPELAGRTDQIAFTVEVPAGAVFVMGDNRANSRDSRCHLNDPGAVVGAGAFVPVDHIVGRAVAVVWPVGRWHAVATSDTLAAVPDAEPPARQDPLVIIEDGVRC